MSTLIQSEASSDCNLLASCPSSHPSLSSSNLQPHDEPFHLFRNQHAALLRRAHGSPLPDGQVEAGDTRDGYGVKLFEDGRLYAGDFEGGLRSGYGVQRWPDGHVYVGLWKYGRREGEGEYRFSHGDIDGSGVIEDNECDVYHGEWLNDMFHGAGIYRHINGDEYTGQFKENQMHGIGTYVAADGTTFSGRFSEGDLVEYDVHGGIDDNASTLDVFELKDRKDLFGAVAAADAAGAAAPTVHMLHERHMLQQQYLHEQHLQEEKEHALQQKKKEDELLLQHHDHGADDYGGIEGSASFSDHGHKVPSMISTDTTYHADADASPRLISHATQISSDHAQTYNEPIKPKTPKVLKFAEHLSPLLTSSSSSNLQPPLPPLHLALDEQDEMPQGGIGQEARNLTHEFHRIEEVFACPILNCWPPPPPVDVNVALQDTLHSYCKNAPGDDEVKSNCTLAALSALESVRASYSKVLCIALLNVAYARSERDAVKAAALKSRRGSSSSHHTTIISAFDIQATTQVAAVLQRLMLLYNVVAPAVVLRFCQNTPRDDLAGGVDDVESEVLLIGDDVITPAPALPGVSLPDAEAASIVLDLSLQAAHALQKLALALPLGKSSGMLVQEELWQQLQRWGIAVHNAASSAASEEPLVMAMSLQQRVLQAAELLSLQIPHNPITANPPAPISLSGEPEPLPHLPPPPPTPRVYSLNAVDVQPILDSACAGSTIWLLPASGEQTVSPETRVKIRRPGLCISTFPAIYSALPPSLREFLGRGGGQGLSVGVASGMPATANANQENPELHDDESRWSRDAELHAVSVTSAHVFFSCIRFSSHPSQFSASSTPPALRISRGGCGVVLVDCRISAPSSAAIVCHVKRLTFDENRGATPTCFSDARSAAASPTFSRPNSTNRSSSNSPVLNSLHRIGSFSSDGRSSPNLTDGDNRGNCNIMTLVGWRCKVQNSAQGVGCVRARCMFLQSVFHRFLQSACESHGHGAQMQLVRCHFQHCRDSMLVSNSCGWLHVTSCSFEQCYSAARCVDRSTLIIVSSAIENVSHSTVTATLGSSFFCRSCSFREVGLECSTAIFVVIGNSSSILLEQVFCRSLAMCVLALDCSLVDLRNCRMIVPLAGGKVAVHICQALMRMQHCNIAGGNCSVLASHSAICNIAHVQLHSIDSVGLAAVSGSFIHAHAVIVDSVRFAAFAAVSPVSPGSAIDNSQSGIMQLRECQCTSSLRYGCIVIGSAVIDCRGCVWSRCAKGSRAMYCPPAFLSSKLAEIDSQFLVCHYDQLLKLSQYIQIIESDNDASSVEGFSSQVYEPALICSASDAPPPPAVLRRNIDTSGWKIPTASKLLLSISNQNSVSKQYSSVEDTDMFGPGIGHLLSSMKWGEVEALGLIPQHLLSRLRGKDSAVDDVQNPLQIMRQSIEDAKKGTNGRLPDNYRQFYQEGAFESSSSMIAWNNASASGSIIGASADVCNVLSPVKAVPNPSFSFLSTTAPPPRPVLPLRPPSPSSLGALYIPSSVASLLHETRQTLDARVSSPERVRTSWADATGSKAKKVVGKQEFTISSGLAEVLGPAPLDCEGPGCRAVATTLPPPHHARAVYSDMMKGGTGASDKPPLESRAAALGLKVAQAEAVAAYHANHTAMEQQGHIARSQSPNVSNGSSSSEAALALDAAYAQRLTDFMAGVKFKATNHAMQRSARLQQLQLEPSPAKKLGNMSLAEQAASSPSFVQRQLKLMGTASGDSKLQRKIEQQIKRKQQQDAL